MSRFYIKLGILLSILTALTMSTAVYAGGISFFVGFPQTPMVQPVYMPRPYKQCYIERPMYVNGMMYPGRRICEHRFAPTPAAYIPNGPDYYQIHRHHVSYKYYY